jgi:class 3 adenylate cyclase
MPPLSAKRRADLPDSAFAYIDSRGRRRLPIHDEAHVRNALARFRQVSFESEAAMDRARTRLLKAAKRYGIMPIGFIDGQLHAQSPRNLPTGELTFLLSDIEGSTGLLERLGDRYAAVLAELRRMLRGGVRRYHGREIDARADEFFAAFTRPGEALQAAIAVQRAVGRKRWPDGEALRLRIGLHAGAPALTDAGYVGLPVHAAARVAFAGHGGQIVVSEAARRAIEANGGELPDGIGFAELGRHRLQGLSEPIDLYEVRGPDLPSGFPPPRIGMPAAITTAAAERTT